MKNINKVAVIGGTGKSGKFLVQLLKKRAIPTRLLKRNLSENEPESSIINVIQGDARNEDDIFQLLKGCDAIISFLGQPKNESPIFSTATKNILKAMKSQHIKRYLLLAGINVDTPFDQKSPKSKQITNWMKSKFPDISADRQKEYELLLKSQTDWTLLRVPLIETSDVSGEIIWDLKDSVGDVIYAKELAAFAIDQLTSKKLTKSAPFLASI